MNKVLRIISVALMGAASAAMFLLWTPVFNGQTVAEYIKNNDIVVYVLAGLLALSGLLCVKAAGFRKKKIMRIIIAVIAVAISIVPSKVSLPTTVPAGDLLIFIRPLILGAGYAFVFIYLFVLHFIEQFSRRGFSKIFSPLADLAMVIAVALIYINSIVPEISKASFYEYIELAHQYIPYVAGGLLALEFAFGVLELFIRKPLKEANK